MSKISGYQAHIDGLRTLAVLIVLLFHFEIPPFKGGYIGVDVFFVISGYLIIGMITGKVQSGTFSLKDFYMRRIRRLFPAIFITLIGTLIAACLIMSPSDLLQTGKNAVLGALSVINLSLAGTGSDYFAEDHSNNPLLHFWSLAVEEQFYLVFPFIAFAMSKVFKNTKGMITTYVVIAAISFIAAEIIIRNGGQTFAYYMMPTRFGELLIGGVLALYQKQKSELSTNVNRQPLFAVGCWLAFSIILINGMLLSSESRFPGMNALPACLATAFLIHFGMTKGFSFVLSNPVSTYIGKMSYSLYLVHWPIYALMVYHLGSKLNTLQTLGVIIATFASSALILNFVENPIRFNPKYKGKKITKALLPLATVFTAIAGTAIISNGLPNRIPAERMVFVENSGDFHRNYFGGFGYPKGEAVILGDKMVEPSFIILGDSRARQLALGLDETLASKGASAIGVFRDGCPFLISAQPLLNGKRFEGCETTTKLAKEITSRFDIPIVMTSSWSQYQESVFVTPEGPARRLRQDEYFSYVKETIEYLSNHDSQNTSDVILLSEISSVGSGLPPISCMTRPNFLGHPCSKLTAIDSDEINRSTKTLDLMESLNLVNNVRFVEVFDALCNEQQCAQVLNGEILYSDGFHISTFGSKIAAPVILDRLGLTLSKKSTANTLEKLPVISSLNVKTLPLSEFPFPIEQMRPLTLINASVPEKAFKVFRAEDALVFKRDICLKENKPFYFTLQYYPESLDDVKTPGGSQNNADFIPVFYQDSDACYAFTKLPNYSIRQIYVGQTERNLGRQWIAKINGDELR